MRWLGHVRYLWSAPFGARVSSWSVPPQAWWCLLITVVLCLLGALRWTAGADAQLGKAEPAMKQQGCHDVPEASVLWGLFQAIPGVPLVAEMGADLLGWADASYRVNIKYAFFNSLLGPLVGIAGACCTFSLCKWLFAWTMTGSDTSHIQALLHLKALSDAGPKGRNLQTLGALNPLVLENLLGGKKDSLEWYGPQPAFRPEHPDCTLQTRVIRGTEPQGMQVSSLSPLPAYGVQGHGFSNSNPTVAPAYVHTDPPPLALRGSPQSNPGLSAVGIPHSPHAMFREWDSNPPHPRFLPIGYRRRCLRRGCSLLLP